MSVRSFTALMLVLLSALRAFGQPSQALAVAFSDCRKLSPDAQQHVRYLSFYNVPLVDLPTARKVVTFQLNAVSRNAEIRFPVSVRPDLFRIDLREYQISTKVWDKLAESDPYFHVTVREQWPGGIDPVDGLNYKAGTYLRPGVSAPWLDPNIVVLSSMTYSKAPLLRADWWFVQAARQLNLNNQDAGTGYYDFLGIKNRDDFFKLIVMNEKDSRKIGRDIKAAVDKSGVAKQNRQIIRLQSLTGGSWVTLDTSNSTGRGNAVRNLKDGDYDHEAEEHFGVLPNRLPVVLLCDKGGKLQPSAPDFIGVDDSPLRTGKDARIHVGKNCWNCHLSESGLRSIDDWARRTLQKPLGLQAVSYDDFTTLNRQYFSSLVRDLKADRSVYEEAFLECCGMKPAELAKAFAAQWDWYAERDRTLADMAVEIGTTAPLLLTALKAEALTVGYADLPFSGFLKEDADGKPAPETVRIEYVEEFYPALQGIYRKHRR